MVDRTRSGSRKAPGALRLPGLRATGCKLVACSAAPSEQAITEMDAVPAMALHRVFGPWTGWVACHAVHAHPTRGLDCPSSRVVVLAQWQLVSLQEVTVSSSIQVSQPFGPTWGEFGPMTVPSLPATAHQDLNSLRTRPRNQHEQASRK